MKRLNRKGFTLIELMAVIAILVIIMGIALPNITSSIERSKQKQKEARIKLIVSAGELYFDKYKSKSKMDGVTSGELINEEYLQSSDIEDTCDNDDDIYCCVVFEGSKFVFKSDVDDCDDAY